MTNKPLKTLSSTGLISVMAILGALLSPPLRQCLGYRVLITLSCLLHVGLYVGMVTLDMFVIITGSALTGLEGYEIFLNNTYRFRGIRNLRKIISLATRILLCCTLLRQHLYSRCICLVVGPTVVHKSV